MRDDKGLAIVMTAVLMVVLLVMTAFAVDIGAQLAERRQDQTAADSGAMAGIQNIIVSADRDTAASDAIATVRKNLPTKYPEVKWREMWTSCVDPKAGPEFPNKYASAVSPCVRFNSGGSRMRVTLPKQLVNAQFSSVIGFKNLESSATAISQLSFPGGGLLPFAIDSNAQPDNQLCAAEPAKCDGSSSDALRVLDSPVVGNAQFGTQNFTSCTVPIDYNVLALEMRTRASLNTAMGVDHTILSFRAGRPRRDDLCEQLFPNHVFWYDFQKFKDSPNMPRFLEGFREGLVGDFVGAGAPKFPDGLGPRLSRTKNNTRLFGAMPIDDRPLWQYISADLAPPDIPPSCKRSLFESAPAAGWKLMTTTCLRDFIKAPVGTTYRPLFTERSAGTPPGQFDAQISPRFAVLPIVKSGDGDPNPSPVTGWRFGFIQTIYVGYGIEFHNPGQGAGNLTPPVGFTGVSIFQIQDAMLPVEMRGALAVDDRAAVFSLVL